MAKNDYKPVTAEDLLAPTADNSVDEDAAERAADAGVVDASYIDYEQALQNYEARSDVETLAQRRAREVGADFSDASFRRSVASGEGNGVVTSGKATPKAATQK